MNMMQIIVSLIIVGGAYSYMNSKTVSKRLRNSIVKIRQQVYEKSMTGKYANDIDREKDLAKIDAYGDVLKLLNIDDGETLNSMKVKDTVGMK